MKKHNRIKAAWPFVAVAAVVAVALCQVATMTLTRDAAAGPKSARRTIRLTLHGSTPTMAWSPNSKRLVANAAYEYYGFRREVSRNKSGLGVYVVTLKTGRSKRIHTDQGYHPLWINNNTVAWGHSPYEDGTPGLYVADLRRNKVKRLGKYKGVYHTLFSSKRRILFYSGWPEYKRWVLADVRTGRLKKVRVKRSRRRRRRPPARPPLGQGKLGHPPRRKFLGTAGGQVQKPVFAEGGQNRRRSQPGPGGMAGHQDTDGPTLPGRLHVLQLRRRPLLGGITALRRGQALHLPRRPLRRFPHPRRIHRGLPVEHRPGSLTPSQPSRLPLLPSRIHPSIRPQPDHHGVDGQVAGRLLPRR